MNRCADVGVAVAHDLAHIDVVALFDGRNTGRADVLLHRQSDPLRRGHNDGGSVPRVLVMRNRRAAMGPERVLWELHSFRPAFLRLLDSEK